MGPPPHAMSFCNRRACCIPRRMAAQQTLLHPHPFGGSVTMASSFSSSETADLTKLNVPRVTTSGSLMTPSISFSSWKTYQLYQGGFRYSAETLCSSTLDNIVLRPSQRNPLGIFYKEGNLTIDDNVVVQGTLVCSGKITFTGNNVVVGSVNWRDSAGGPAGLDGKLISSVSDHRREQHSIELWNTCLRRRSRLADEYSDRCGWQLRFRLRQQRQRHGK